LRRTTIALLALTAAISSSSAIAAHLDACLAERKLGRIARVQDPGGVVWYARVVSDTDGVPDAFSLIAPGDTDLASVFDRASAPSEIRAESILAPVPITQAQIDAEERVVVAPGLNYAAHAEEAGGGDVFLFPKPVEPTSPYAELLPPPHVKLLDYEVELAFVLLSEIDLRKPPARDALLAGVAFFIANDVSDREPIIREAALFGHGTGFVEAKGQPGFLPAGPWMVRGTELFDAVAACGAEGLGIRLSVDSGDGFRPRQDSNTAHMILDPVALIARLAAEVEHGGVRTEMPIQRDGKPRFYPLAIGPDPPILPAGSVILTGTPDGVAIKAPDPLAVTLRGLRHLRSPTEQFRVEELARAASGAEGAYLRPGDRVRASIDGLGAQVFRIGPARSP
jgi:2-keto-4-pentenoate hydratase/2-oxohepta-3-ene-1,7-dioic acid hydratase in catechol pathway